MIIGKLTENYPKLKECISDIQKSCKTIIECYESGGKVLICGNGGSAADSEHIAGELLKGFMKKRPLSDEQKKNINDEIADRLQQGLPAISLVSQSSIITAVSNDLGDDLIFAQQVMAYAKVNDVIIGLSTSGNSKNIVNAFKVAKALNMKIIALTGEKNSIMSSLANVAIKVPSSITPDIQEYHFPIYHAICKEVEEYFYNI